MMTLGTRAPWRREHKVDFQDLGHALKRVKARSQASSLWPTQYPAPRTANLHALVRVLGDDLDATVAGWAQP